MGWLEGLLGGYQSRNWEIQEQKRQEAAQSQQREMQVFQALLDSPDPEIRALAGTGILEATQPRKRKGGFSGWLGEMEGSQIYPRMLELLKTPVRVPGQPGVDAQEGTLPSRSFGPGSMEALQQAPGAQPMGTPDHAMTEPGAPAPPALRSIPGGVEGIPPQAGFGATPANVGRVPPTLGASMASGQGDIEGAYTPAPPQPQGPGTTLSHAIPEVIAQPPPRPQQVPTTPGPKHVAIGGVPDLGPLASETRPGKAAVKGRAATPDTFRPREAFPSPETRMAMATKEEEQRYMARLTGETKGLSASLLQGYLAEGMDPQEAQGKADSEAARLISLEYQRRYGMGATGYQSIPGELADGTPYYATFDRAKGVYVDPASGEPLPGFRPRQTTGSVSMGADREAIARATYGKPFSALTSEQQQDVNQRTDERAVNMPGQKRAGVAEVEARIPLTTQQRHQGLVDYQKQWTDKAGPGLNVMTDALTKMKVGAQDLTNPRKSRLGAAIDIITTYQKILDPGSVVRESEYARVINGQSWGQWLNGLWESNAIYKDPRTGDWMQKGGEPITNEVLMEMVDLAQRFLDATRMNYADDLFQLREAAKADGPEVRYDLVAPANDVEALLGTAALERDLVFAEQWKAHFARPVSGAPGQAAPDAGMPGTGDDLFVNEAGELVDAQGRPVGF